MSARNVVALVSAINGRLDQHKKANGASRFAAFRRWSVENWLKGFKYGPVQRCRVCDHTTPYHYESCVAGRVEP